jgi:beta-glucosidase
MKGRTYRYFKGTPWYPFGFGISYSSFAYSGLALRRSARGADVSAIVKNTSARDGEEVVQVYVGGGPEAGAPLRSLRGFARVTLRAGESRTVSFTIAGEELPASAVDVSVGGGQPLAPVAYVKGSLGL